MNNVCYLTFSHRLFPCYSPDMFGPEGETLYHLDSGGHSYNRKVAAFSVNILIVSGSVNANSVQYPTVSIGNKNLFHNVDV